MNDKMRSIYYKKAFNNPAESTPPQRWACRLPLALALSSILVLGGCFAPPTGDDYFQVKPITNNPDYTGEQATLALPV